MSGLNQRSAENHAWRIPSAPRHKLAGYSIVLISLFCCAQLTAWQVTVEVEDLTGSWREQTNIRGFLGRGFRTSNANPDIAPTPLTGSVDLPAAGIYIVWTRGYTSPGGQRGYRIQIGPHRLEPTHEDGRRGWWWRRCGQVQLPAGSVQVQVVDAGRGFESADTIVITDEEDFDPMAEDKMWQSFSDELPDDANALTRIIQTCVAVCRQRTTADNLAQWQEREPTIRRELARALGLDPLPERTPLNARITGRDEREQYRVENLIFESRPDFHVTANLYLPTSGQAPFPCVVVVPGHAMTEGKNYGLYHKAQLGLVQLGFAVLAYDPIGQGERKRPGFDHILGYGSLMVGQCNEGMIVWDTMRAIDYLCTRPDIDSQRIGLSGNSGGGENTFYTMPLDPRIKAGASFCFTCSYELWLRDGGNHCICNHMPGIIKHMEQFEIVGVNAPRPFLIGNASGDPIFPIDGTRSTRERAGNIYGFHGAEDAIRLVETPGGHGWSKPLREAAYGWFSKWLLGQGDGGPIPEPDLPEEPYDAPHLLCIKEGEEFPAPAETVVSLNRTRGEELAATRPTPSRSAIWKLLGGRPEDYEPEAEIIHEILLDVAKVQTVALTVEPTLRIAATLAMPRDSTPSAAVVFVTDSTRRTLVESDLCRQLLTQGFAVAVVNPRGTGEASVHQNHVTSNSVVLGRPLFGQQVWDVMQTLKWTAAAIGKTEDATVVTGEEACGMLALFAGVLADSAGIAATRLPASFADTLDNRLRYPLWFYLPNVLAVTDVGPTLALADKTDALILNSVGRAKQPIGERSAEDKLAQAVRAYDKQQNTTLTIVRTEQERENQALLEWLDANRPKQHNE